MNPHDNPFAFDDENSGSSPFGTPDQVVCCKCGGTVPREDATFKVKSGTSWWSILFWGPILGLILGDDKQERGNYCPLCLQLFRRDERRKKILVTVALVVIVVLTILMELIS
jgi:hypothetical protein